MRVTCIMILIILHTTHNILHITRKILHIAHNILHIIRSYAMRPQNYGHDIKTTQNEGSTYVTSTREPSLSNTVSDSFIHTYFISFHSQASVNTSYTQDVVYDFHRVRCAMIKNDLASLLKSISPLDYPLLTLLASFISLCALFEADLIHSWGTLTLTDIYHVSIMKSCVSPTP